MRILNKFRNSFLTTGILLAILILGSYLRLYKISEYMTFLGDEGRDMLVVEHMIVDHKFTLLGPTASVGGFFMGPIYYYFMLPFLWLWRLDPSGPAVMVALFGIATIYLVYRTGKDFFNMWVGLIAASLYAVSPLVIAYSRSSWNPNPVPFFSILLMYLLWHAALGKKISTYVWIGVVLGIGLQLHYLFSFLFVATAVWIFFFAKPTPMIKAIAATFIGFVIGYSPFLLFEVRHGFPNTQTVIRFLATGKDTGFRLVTFFGNINDTVFRIFGRLLLRFPQPEWWYRYAVWQKWAWLTSTRLFIFFSIGTVMFLLLQPRLEIKQKRGVQLLAIWFAVTILLFGFYKRAIYDYYFGIVFTLPFILIGLVLWLIARQKTIGKVVVAAVMVGLLFFNWQGRPFLFPPNNQLGQTKNIAAQALAKTAGKPFNFALITGNNSDHAYRYFFEIWGHPPVTIENQANDPKRQTVTDQLIIICEIPKTMCQPLGNSLWEVAGFGRADMGGTWEESFITIYRLVHYKGPQ
ncbi:glycosyltransferase family 39 protein [Candidatus Gottesmanbacteria bacterium]|nr:glycosyltransferase family 39 protein [Candidatus Gottesmanbacteria bacterium]